MLKINFLNLCIYVISTWVYKFLFLQTEIRKSLQRVELNSFDICITNVCVEKENRSLKKIFSFACEINEKEPLKQDWMRIQIKTGVIMTLGNLFFLL